jgi:hypothetical protein
MNSRQANNAALAAGALGLIACFMPLMEGGPSFFDAVKAGITDGYVVFGGYAVVLVCAGLAMKNGDFTKQLAIGVTVGSAIALLKVRDGLDLPGMTGKLLLLAAVVGLAAGIVGIMKAGSGGYSRGGAGKKGLGSLFSGLGGSKGSGRRSIVSTNSGAPKRFKMLRHSRFIQFPRLQFGKNLTPHKMHWIIEEALEDQGVTNVNSVGPVCVNHWTKVVPGENGHVANVADYMPFEGGFTGSRGEALPSFLKLAMFVTVLLALVLSALNPIVGLLGWIGAFGLAVFIWHWNTYRRGTVSMLYRGMYTIPDDDSAKGNDWKFTVDMMFSVNVKKPLIGEAIGSEVVAPIYAYIEESLRNDLTTTKGLRFLPELITRKRSQLEMRFPVEQQH